MKKNIVFYVTRQYMKRNRRRTWTTFAGIFFMVLLMTGLFIGKDTGISYLEQAASLKDGKWHVSMYDVTSAQYREVRQLPYVRQTALSVNRGSTLLKQSANQERPYLNIKGYTDSCFDWMNIRLAEGSLPKKKGELLISKSILDDGAKLSIGDTIDAEYFTRSLTGTNPGVKETVFPFYNLTLKYGATEQVSDTRTILLPIL